MAIMAESEVKKTFYLLTQRINLDPRKKIQILILHIFPRMPHLSLGIWNIIYMTPTNRQTDRQCSLSHENADAHISVRIIYNCIYISIVNFGQVMLTLYLLASQPPDVYDKL